MSPLSTLVALIMNHIPSHFPSQLFLLLLIISFSDPPASLPPVALRSLPHKRHVVLASFAKILSLATVATLPLLSGLRQHDQGPLLLGGPSAVV